MSIRKGDFKLIEFFEDGKTELYDLSKDLSEQSNLAQTMPEKTAELLADLQAQRPLPTVERFQLVRRKRSELASASTI